MWEKIKLLSKSKNFLHPFDGFCKIFFPIIPKWLLPNHLTLVRLLGTPFVIVLLCLNYYVYGLILFLILALTDMFDGALARGRDQITYIGILLDPIADKFLVASAVAVLLFKVNWLLATVVIGLEVLFLVGGLIKTSKKKAVDLEANLWGKVKMNVQVWGAVFVFIGLMSGRVGFISAGEWTFWFSAFLAVGNLVSRLIEPSKE